MPWFTLVLYLHLVAVVAALAFASYLHLGLERLGRAGTTTEALAALKLCARGGATMPWVGLALVFTGAYLTQAAFTWTTPWIDVSIAGVLALEAVGSIGSTRRRRMALALGDRSAAPLDAVRSRAIRDPLARSAGYLLPLLTLGIMLIMVVKPELLASLGILLAAIVVGVVAGRCGVTRPAWA